MATSACLSSARARICSTLPAPTKVAGWTRRSACTVSPATTSPAVSARRASSASDSLAGRSIWGRSVPTRIARSCLAAVVCARSLTGRTSPLRKMLWARTVARGGGGRQPKARPRSRSRRTTPTRHLGEGGEQLLGVERLRHVRVEAGGERTLAVLLASVRGDRDGGQGLRALRALLPSHLLDQRVAVLARHPEVGQEEVDPPATEHVERIGDRGRGPRLRAIFRDQLREHGRGVGVVLDDEDVQPVETGMVGPGAPPGLAGAENQLPFEHGQPHPERRALPLAATGCLDAASVQLDQLPHDREPDAETPVRASARAVGLPEALEQLGQERR